MKIDIEDNTFDQRKYFSRVLMQQGKVLTAADSNERDDILLYFLRTLAADLIGLHGGPVAKAGFEIALVTGTTGALTDLEIGRGRYYVDGILCENDRVDREGKEVEVTYLTQPDYPLPDEENGLPDNFLVYLDVWERHITAVEDPDIREVALGGPDTAARARVVWQVKITDKMPDESDITSEITKDTVEDYWDQWVKKWQPTNRGKLKAKAKEDPDKDTEPCIISPEARYRGVENQLYRVEIHRSGAATQQEATDYEQGDGTSGGIATFKWSRDNGSVVFPIRDLDGNVVTLEHLGRDSRLSLKVGDWVEIEDDDYALQGRAEPLLRIEAIDPIDMRVTLNKPSSPGVGQDPTKHPLLRRWDHGAGDSEKGELEPETGTLLVEEGTWLELEDGVQIYFRSAIKEYTIQPGDTLSEIAQRFGTTVEELQRLKDIPDPDFIRAGDVLEVPVYHKYRPGDYWLIPARTATGDVEWPGEVGQPEARSPHGIEHHYAPLAIVVSTEDNGVVDCRRRFEPNVSVNGLVARYGSAIKLRHLLTGRTLHSHPHNYGHQGTSGQQQVTAFGGADDNDFWRVKGADGQPEDSRAGQPVQDGDIVRLEHVLTRRNLHSHGGIPSPVTGQQEVTCFGENGIGDGNDNWRVEIEGGGTWDAGKRMRLIHVGTDHALHSHEGFSHSDWTMGQQEVTGFLQRDDNDWWSLF
jgi:LysM repeat protein